MPSGDIQAFADAVERLLDDAEARVDLGLARGARRRAPRLAAAVRAYVSVFDRIFPKVGVPVADAEPAEITYVDLDAENEFRRFVLARGPVRDHALGA